MEYLHYFNTKTEHDTVYNDWGDAYKEPWVGYIEATDTITLNSDDYVPVPSGYRFLKTGVAIVDNYSYLLIGSTYYDEYDWCTGLCFMYNNNIYQVGKRLDDHHEFSGLTITGLSSGTYNGIFLQQK